MTIDWNETRACRECCRHAGKQRMVLTSIANTTALTKVETIGHFDEVLASTGDHIVKIFGCPKCGLRITEKGVLP